MPTNLIIIFFFVLLNSFAQPLNYICNGSFEETYNNCSKPNKAQIARGWSSIDSVSYFGIYFSKCPGINNVPKNANAYQMPKSGESYVISTFLCKTPACGPISVRGYLRNRLEMTMKAGITYCLKYHVNIANASSYGLSSFGAYFASEMIDTITKCTIPLSYLKPQILSPIDSIVIDTLNWVTMTGTYVANGTEKYLILGNFSADSDVKIDTANIDYLPSVFTDVCVDDVSLFEVDAHAFAGSDVSISEGESVFLGIPGNFANDPYCQWYQVPNDSLPIDTAAGIWVKPTLKTTYVVRQQLWCSGVKWDTVTVHINNLGLIEGELTAGTISVYPNPTNSDLTIKFDTVAKCVLR